MKTGGWRCQFLLVLLQFGPRWSTVPIISITPFLTLSGMYAVL